MKKLIFPFAISLAYLYNEKSKFPKRYFSYDDSIEKYSKMFNVSKALIKAIIRKESDFVYATMGTSGELGLMQIMQKTALGLNANMGKYLSMEPDYNIFLGTKLLRELLDKYDFLTAINRYNCASCSFSKNYKYISKVFYYYLLFSLP